MSEEKSVFETLNSVNVNKHTEQKQNLTYLSWAWAWAEVKKLYPNASYKVWKDENNNPYTFNETLGYMCYTTVTIEDQTLEMWLPVMNGVNKAMLNKEYTYKVKDWTESKLQKKDVFMDKTVEAATMFDINKTVMRCLVKNLAMFGLGLYIYSGEDLPEQPPVKTKISPKQLEQAKERVSKMTEEKSVNELIRKLIDAFDLEQEVAEDIFKSYQGETNNNELQAENESLKREHQ